jgi:hypothetical protein
MHQKNRCRYPVKLSGILSLIVALLTSSIPATVAAAEEAVLDAKVAICKDLKPFNNLDELLYQFYINLDSDCLFKMPVAELETVWDIKILSEERVRKSYEEWEIKPWPDYEEQENLNSARFQLRKNSDFENKPYKSEKDAFFVEKNKTNITNFNYFYIKIAKEYYEKHATLFPDGNYPKLLPEPRRKWIHISIHPSPDTDKFPRPKTKGMYDLFRYYYYWLNTEQTRMIGIYGQYGVIAIGIMDGVHSWLDQQSR